MEHYVLTLIIFIPIVGMAAVLCLPRQAHDLIRWTAFLFTLPPFFLGVWLYRNFNGAVPDLQFTVNVPWIASYNIHYFVGVDGVSISMVLLTVLLCPLCIVASWGIERAVKGYFALFLQLDAAMVGVFCAMDFFLFYIFWELMLLPMYFLIGIWGGPRREYAAIKFFLYTLVGSLAMLLAILIMYFNAQPHSFSMLRLIEQQPLAAKPVLAALAFWGFFLSFAIKVPMWPFHTWLPDAHVEAPTAGSVILAGVLLKMRTYGFVRVSLPMLPEAFRIYAPAVAVLALLGIVYGALVAMAQTDLKKLVAYSSVNHMGYVMLGVASAAAAAGIPEKAVAAATALNGAVFEMVAHGIITGALFLIVGVLYDFRAHTRGVDEFGGLGARLPMYSGITMVAMLASLGLPGLMGFVAEFFIFVGSFGIFPYLTVVAVTGVIFTAAMFLWTIQRIFLGPFNERWAGLPDLDTREKISLMPLAVLMVIFGLYPKPLLDVINAAMTTLVAMVR